MHARPSRSARSGLAARLAFGVWIVVPGLGCRTENATPDPAIPPSLGSEVPVRTSTLQAGPPGPSVTVQNPFEGNVHAIQDGSRFYEWFNCGGCHGAIGGGAIGPPLRDEAWIYGNAPENVYQSIAQGRPNGMPAFRDRIPEEALWRLVAHVRSMGGAPSKEERGAVVAEEERSPDTQPTSGGTNASQ